MAIPVELQDVEKALRPWLGTLFLTSTPMAQEITNKLQEYAPYRQTLESLHAEMESFLLRGISRYTAAEMRVVLDNYHPVRLRLQDISWMTDDVMGVLFDKLTPFSMNFIKLNDYALRVESLAAMRVLYQKYAEFFTEEEYLYLAKMIRRIYPEYRYEAWLGTPGSGC